MSSPVFYFSCVFRSFFFVGSLDWINENCFSYISKTYLEFYLSSSFPLLALTFPVLLPFPFPSDSTSASGSASALTNYWFRYIIRHIQMSLIHLEFYLLSFPLAFPFPLPLPPLPLPLAMTSALLFLLFPFPSSSDSTSASALTNYWYLGI